MLSIVSSIFTLLKVCAVESNIGHKCKRFYYYYFQVREKYQEKNLKTEYILSRGKNNAFSMKTVFM